MLRSIVVKFTSAPVGGAAVRMFGNTGAPVCVGDRLTFTCCRLLGSVVFPAESNAFASARRGTRSKNRPALPRTTVRLDAVGIQAKPARGDRLLRSVLMVCRN